MSSLLKFYTSSLQKNPKTTNAIMTGSLFGIGDAVAQIYFPAGSSQGKYDTARTLRAVAFGSLVFSFIGDKWYKILNTRIGFKDRPATHWSNLLLRVGTDQAVFAPLAAPLYFGVLTLMEGRPLSAARRKISDNWWETLKTNWMVWPWVQLANFSLVPVQHRLLTVNVVAIFWNTYLSFRNAKTTDPSHKLPVQYPPMPE
ncbi:LAMI_0H10264g1_1 [Lachancea mirantina]|uniref:Protein SYM1 n=1 Tax=Lachancea mirantina TaxID=1230905 RepID=A0A1G4KGM1_9SACH|nr:LAMI_0H10264g1_1 [Lachancea mirantina]